MSHQDIIKQPLPDRPKDKLGRNCKNCRKKCGIRSFCLACSKILTAEQKRRLFKDTSNS